MKWTLLTGAFGLAIGFFVGSAREEVSEEKEAATVVKSERRLSSRGERNREVQNSQERTWNAERAMQEAGDLGSQRSEISRARLMKWILELEATDFPEVLTKFEKLYEPIDDPFETGPEIGVYLTLAMARWYELEGESVLQWISAKPEILPEDTPGKLMQELIQDGYHRNPTLSLKLMKKYAETMLRDLGDEGISENLSYEVGRWTENLESEFDGIVKLFEIFGDVFVTSDPDPFADESELGSALVRGIIHAGREKEARLIFSNGKPEWLALLDEISASEKTTQLAEQGWRELKSALDSGELENDSSRAQKVLNEWAAEDPGEALSWYLTQRFTDADRASQITDAVFSKAFYRERDGISRSKVRVDEAIEFLDQLRGAGEPVEGAFSSLMAHEVRTEEWESVDQLMTKVSSETWELGMSLIKETSTENDYQTLENGGRIILPLIYQEKAEVLERFGLLEEVNESIAAARGEALEELRKMIEGE